MKQRFSSLDLQAVTGEINEKLQDTRLANIYDINSRTFVLKFAKQGEKHNLLIESGNRVHLTEFTRETATTPSNFCVKLRKHIRTRRITQAKQLGTDRVFVLVFGGGENHSDPDKSFYLIAEFYAGGNVILTDGHRRILSLLRVVTEDEGQKVSVGEVYDFERRTASDFCPISAERLTSAIDGTARKKDDDDEVDSTPSNPLQPSARRPKKKDKGPPTIKKALAANLSQYGAALVEHTIIEAGLKPSEPVSSIPSDSDEFSKLLEAFKLADQILRQCSSVKAGYIISKSDGPHEVFDDFQPFLPNQVTQNQTLKAVEVASYNACADQFFSSIESQKLEQRIRTQESLAAKRIQSSKDEHQKKIEGLIAAQETSAQKAAALEASQGLVDEAINAVNTLVDQGMDWLDIEHLIKTEARQGNPVAEVIKLPLKLESNKITVLVKDLDSLYETDTESGNETESSESSSSSSTSASSTGSTRSDKLSKYLQVDVDLSQTAFANARQYYAIRRTAITKEEKTQQSSKKALRSAQMKAEKDLKKHLSQEKSLMRPIRKVYWFEKFLWFISSEGYLVLGGHDAQQNEQLFKRYFKKGDCYVHADLNGAATVIVRNTHQDQPIPPSTLSQAGTLAVATSHAWDAKMVISAWWVQHDQVSKTAPTGEYLTTGSFMIRGKKNFLPPAKLELGYGLLWVVDESSRDRHLKSKLADQIVEKSFTEPVVDVDQRDLRASETSENYNKTDSGHVSELDHDQEATSEVEIVNEDESEVPATNQDKYALSEYGQDSVVIDKDDNFSGKAKHMSAKQRREAKKPKADQPDPDSRQEDISKSAANNENKSKIQALTRGQKSKKKKLAKYADQDDDDLALAQKILGVQIKKETPSEEVGMISDTPQLNKVETKPKKNPEIAQILKDENVALLDEDEQDLLTPLDIFVSSPFSDDVLVEAIPTCAPYAAMARYKYRCKLQPGTTKKGKALRGVIAAWSAAKVDENKENKEALWPRERELMKGLKDTELISPVGVSKIKVSMGKGDTQAKNSKKGKGKRQ